MALLVAERYCSLLFLTCTSTTSSICTVSRSRVLKVRRRVSYERYCFTEVINFYRGCSAGELGDQ